MCSCCKTTGNPPPTKPSQVLHQSTPRPGSARTWGWIIIHHRGADETPRGQRPGLCLNSASSHLRHPENLTCRCRLWVQGSREWAIIHTSSDLHKVYIKTRASLVAQKVKRLPVMQETWVWFLGREVPLEKEMATHSIILAWKIPWMEKPGRL